MDKNSNLYIRLPFVALRWARHCVNCPARPCPSWLRFLVSLWPPQASRPRPPASLSSADPAEILFLIWVFFSLATLFYKDIL